MTNRTYPERTKDCKLCGTNFAYKSATRTYCSDACVKKVDHARRNSPAHKFNASLYEDRPERKESLRLANRRYWLKKYGITSEDYALALEAQDYSCAICKVHQSLLKKRLSVDHDHSTGLVRELLCSDCNAAIGFLKDSPHLCDKAASYLRKHKAGDK